MLHHDGKKSLLAIPGETERSLVENMIRSIEQGQSSPATRNYRQREQLCLVLFNILRRSCLKSFKKNASGQATICLPHGPQFYSGNYLATHPFLKKVMGKGKLTHRVAINIANWLIMHGIGTETPGKAKFEYIKPLSGNAPPRFVKSKGRISEVALNPLQTWANAETANLYFKLAAEITANRKLKPEAVFRIPNESGTGTVDVPAPGQYLSLVRSINQHTALRPEIPEELKALMQYRLIFGEHEASHARLYAPLTFMRREERQLVMDRIGYVEHDVSACAANICFAMHTGDFFESPRHRDDIYSALLDDIFKTSVASSWKPKGVCYSDVHARGIKQLRPLMKKILTVASGKSCRKMGEVRKTISSILFGNGLLVDIRPVQALETKYKKQNDKSGLIYPGGLSPNQTEAVEAAKAHCMLKASELWRTYCKENNLPDIPVDPRWKFHAIELINVLRSENKNYTPLWNMLFRGSYNHTQNVETMANLYLHEWAMAEGIHIHTLHDAVFTRPEHIDQVASKQKEFILLAARLKRRELLLVEKYHHVVAGIEHVTIPKSFNRFKAETSIKLGPLWQQGQAWIYKPTETESKVLSQGIQQALTWLHSAWQNRETRATRTKTAVFLDGLMSASADFINPAFLPKPLRKIKDDHMGIPAHWICDSATANSEGGAASGKTPDKMQTQTNHAQTDSTALFPFLGFSLAYRITSTSLWRDTKLLWRNLAWT